MWDLSLPDDHECVGQVETEENDSSSSGCDVSLGEEGWQEETQTDSGNGVRKQKDEDQRWTWKCQHVAILKKNNLKCKWQEILHYYGIQKYVKGKTGVYMKRRIIQ